MENNWSELAWSVHNRANSQAQTVSIPPGYALVAFRLPVHGEEYVNSDGLLDYAPYDWTGRGHTEGARKIVRKLE